MICVGSGSSGERVSKNNTYLILISFLFGCFRCNCFRCSYRLLCQHILRSAHYFVVDRTPFWVVCSLEERKRVLNNGMLLVGWGKRGAHTTYFFLHFLEEPFCRWWWVCTHRSSHILQHCTRVIHPDYHCMSILLLLAQLVNKYGGHADC